MKSRLASLLVSLLAASLLSGCVYISRASQSSTGVQANSSSTAPSVSADGRWVAFSSLASNLVPGDTNGVSDVFVRDNLTKTVVRVSVATNGTQGDGHSTFPSISDDGRRVAFSTEATNLRGGDTNGLQDIYYRDRDVDGNGIFDEPGGVLTEVLSISLTTPGFATSGISAAGDQRQRPGRRVPVDRRARTRGHQRADGRLLDPTHRRSPLRAFDQQAARRRSRRWSERLGDRELRRHGRRVRDRRTKPRRGQPERSARCRDLGRALRLLLRSPARPGPCRPTPTSSSPI